MYSMYFKFIAKIFKSRIKFYQPRSELVYNNEQQQKLKPFRPAFFCFIVILTCTFEANFQGAHNPLLLNGAFPTLKGEEHLSISKAYNALHRKAFHEAAQICFALTREKATNFKDPYFILGEIHLQENLYLSAIKYYHQALAYNGAFLIHENKLRLYYNLSEAYYRDNHPEQQIQYLEKIATQPNTSHSKLEQTYINKAHFLLALAYWGFENKGKSLVHLHAMLRANYKKAFATLLLAYYYASRSEEEVAKDYRENFINPEGIANAPDKNQRFQYYYNQFTRELEKLPSTAQARRDIKPYIKLIETVQTYEKSRIEEIYKKRREDFDFLQSSKPNPEKLQQLSALKLSTIEPSAPDRVTSNAAISAKQQASKKHQDILKELENRIEAIYKNNDTPVFLGRSRPSSP